MAAGPKCLRCGSSRMTVAGFVAYHWRSNKWVAQRRTTEMADTNNITCDDCHQLHIIYDMNPPFVLEIDDMEWYKRN